MRGGGLERLARNVSVLAMWCASAGGCVEIHGGAIEVAWAVFAPGGRAINDCTCAAPAIALMRLDLASLDDGSNPCAGKSECRFACSRSTGSTAFDIPPGKYAMSLTAIAADGSDLGASVGFRSTPPITSPVLWGQPTELDALTVEAPCADACNGQLMTRPCARN